MPPGSSAPVVACCVFFLGNPLDAAHSLDRFSSEWDKRRVYVPALLLDNSPATWERTIFSNDMMQLMIAESLAICNFGRLRGSRIVNKKSSRI